MKRPLTGAQAERLLKSVRKVCDLLPSAIGSARDRGGWVYVKDWDKFSEALSQLGDIADTVYPKAKK